MKGGSKNVGSLRDVIYGWSLIPLLCFASPSPSFLEYRGRARDEVSQLCAGYEHSPRDVKSLEKCKEMHTEIPESFLISKKSVYHILVWILFQAMHDVRFKVQPPNTDKRRLESTPTFECHINPMTSKIGCDGVEGRTDGQT